MNDGHEDWCNEAYIPSDIVRLYHHTTDSKHQHSFVEKDKSSIQGTIYRSRWNLNRTKEGLAGLSRAFRLDAVLMPGSAVG